MVLAIKPGRTYTYHLGSGSTPVYLEPVGGRGIVARGTLTLMVMLSLLGSKCSVNHGLCVDGFILSTLRLSPVRFFFVWLLGINHYLFIGRGFLLGEGCLLYPRVL